MDKLSDCILDAIEELIKKAISGIPLTIYFQSVVQAVNTDGTYTIIKDKQKYNVKNSLGTKLSMGQRVWVMIPNGKIKDMHIYGIA